MISNLSKFICFLFLSLLFSCGTADSNDTTENEFQKNLIGSWKLESAERNGSKTGSLDNTYFEFKDNGVMVSNFNLNGEEEEKKYELSQSLIIQEGSPSLEYEIRNLSGSRLHLETELMGANFKLFLVRSKEE
jgi:hypothetical protein